MEASVSSMRHEEMYDNLRLFSKVFHMFRKSSSLAETTFRASKQVGCGVYRFYVTGKVLFRQLENHQKIYTSF